MKPDHSSNYPAHTAKPGTVTKTLATALRAWRVLSLLLFGALALPALATDDAASLGIALEGYAYPHPVQFHQIRYRDEDLRMAYMNVAPSANANGRTVVLMHGANFFGAYWQQTIDALSRAGYHVVVPDQIGFGKSSKPALPYSFHWLAANTKSLLDALGIERVSVVAHSMGGMLATRFTLMYPAMVDHLALANPIGLEDYRVKVPWVPTERIYQALMKQTEADIRAYHKSYYVQWKPEFDELVMVHARMQGSAQFPQFTQARALIAQMIYEQPVVYEFPRLRTPTLLVIGQQDRTALGKARVSADVRATLGQYPRLGREAHAAIETSQLVEWDDVGHVPHLEVPGRFSAALLAFLGS